MSVKDLLNELSARPQGVWAQEYFKAIGFRSGEPEPFSPARARAVYSLLSLPKPYIYKNDLIVGSLRPIFADIAGEDAESAHEVCARYGERSFPTNFDHFAPDYGTAVALGLPGMLGRIEESKQAHADDIKKVQFLDDMKVSLSGLCKMISNYADAAESLIGEDGYDNAVLGKIAENCRAIISRAPRSFEEGLQLVWFCHVAFCFEGRYAMALGRIDRYLYPLFKTDIENGRLTEERATELIANVFIKIYERRIFTGGDDVVNVCVGGSDVDGKCQVNRLSFCVLNAVNNCGIPGPNLTARITDDTPDEFLDRCLQVIGTGLGYPALSNDKINLAALRRFGYGEEDLHDYCMVGCIENFISGCQRPWSDGRFDTPRFFEYLFNNGKAIKYPNDGPDTGDISEIKSMDELMARFEKQLALGARQYAECFLSYNHVPEPDKYTSPLLSCFCRDCIGRGMDINAGGSKYPSVHGAALMGVGTTCDSLAAIEQTVFVEHSATLEEIRQGMLCNFEGMEKLRARLLAAPKYGNNDDRADKYAVWFVNFLAGEFDKYRTEDGGGFYIAMAANISNIHAGRLISATPDGRLAGEPLSDAASPTYGRDTHGATSTVLSLTKPDYSRVACGTVVNQKFSPSMFSDEKRPKLLSLIRVYFAKGGHEVQINSTSREVLKDAMVHPEKYPTMVVRVSGFSAIYVTLDPAVQTDILNRTQQE